jgi:hypothetical protein
VRPHRSTIREQIPAKELVTIVDNIGLPYSGLNLSYSTSAPIGPADADIQVQLTEDHHPTADYVKSCARAQSQYPGVTFYVLPVDIVTQILNFGLSAPIDIQIVGPNLYGNRKLAEKMLNEVRYVPGAADARIQQPFDYPNLTVNVDRTRAERSASRRQNVAQSMLVALSGSFQTTPNFYLDPKTGVTYNVAVQAPQYRLDSLAALKSLPVTGATQSARAGRAAPATAGAGVHRRPGAAARGCAGQRGHHRARHGTGHGEPLQRAAGAGHLHQRGRHRPGHGDAGHAGIIDRHQKDLPRGSHFILRGQSETMKKSYIGLLGGLAFSILLVYLLIVVNFQSWLDPFLIIAALPAALAGIVWFLFLTHTRLSVPALTGAIMCMGVATSNSILVVTFAREQLESAGGRCARAALNAGFVRLRPVVMTALAMIIGMMPMSLGLGDGGEQNAPLGRAVIGGLLLATVATLFFVPAFFSVVHGWLESRRKTASMAQYGPEPSTSLTSFRSSFNMTNESNPNAPISAAGNRRPQRRHEHETAPEQKPISGRTALVGVACAGAGRGLAGFGLLSRRHANRAGRAHQRSGRALGDCRRPPSRVRPWTALCCPAT